MDSETMSRFLRDLGDQPIDLTLLTEKQWAAIEQLWDDPVWQMVMEGRSRKDYSHIIAVLQGVLTVALVVTWMLTMLAFADPNPPKAIWVSIMVSWIVQTALLWVVAALRSKQ